MTDVIIFVPNFIYLFVMVRKMLQSPRKCSGYATELYRMIQNKRAKIKQDIGDAPLNNLR